MRFVDPDRFQKIVLHARKTNPFYAKWIPENGPVPILTRRVLQENNELILNGHEPNGWTSGSTATPVCVHQPPIHNDLDLRDISAMVKMMGGFLPRTLVIARRGENGPPHLLDILTPIEQQIIELKKNYAERAATAIVTYPSNAVMLAQEIARTGADFRFMKRIGLMAESIDASQIAIIKQSFPKARLWSSYSATEVGLIAFQCPFEPEFHHLSSQKLGVEILDDEGRDCELGQVGRIVLTDYLNTDMPLIRYEIGDLAAFGSCPCGKINRPALQKILGKVRGSLLHRDGHRIHFVNFSIAFCSMRGVVQFQVIQHEIMRFTVKLVGEASADIEAKVGAMFEKELGYSPTITVEWHDVIPREASGKYHVAISLV